MWLVQTWNTYGFSAHTVTGEFAEIPKPWEKGAVEYGDYRGNFRRLAVIGNNDTDFYSSRFELIGTFNRIYLDSSSWFVELPLNKRTYPLDASAATPQNRILDFFYYVDIDTAGGWWRIECPYIREVRFWGLPTVPADTYRDWHLHDNNFLDWPLWRVEYGHVYDIIDEYRTTEAYKEALFKKGVGIIPSLPAGAGPMHDTPSPPSQSPPPPRRDPALDSDDPPSLHLRQGTPAQIRQHPSYHSNSGGAPLPGWIDPMQLFGAPTGPVNLVAGRNYPPYEKTGWGQLYYQGLFNRLCLIDHTLGGRLMVEGPIRGIRLCQTYTFPSYV